MTQKWAFTLAGGARLQVTPVVVDGVMYVTAANECFALDAGTGAVLWHYQRPRTSGLLGVAAGGVNRGVAVAGDRVFMATDHAHVIALNRHTGALLWETEMADYRLPAVHAAAIVGLHDSRMGIGQELHGRHLGRRTRRTGQTRAPGHRHSRWTHRVGAAAGGSRQFRGRRPEYRERRRVLRQ